MFCSAASPIYDAEIISTYHSPGGLVHVKSAFCLPSTKTREDDDDFYPILHSICQHRRHSVGKLPKTVTFTLSCPNPVFLSTYMGTSLTVKNGRSSRKDDTYSCDFQKKCSSSWCWTPYRICKCSGPPDYRLRSDNGHTDDEHFENLMYISATTTKAIIAKSLFQWFLLMIPALLSRSLCGNHTDAAEIYFPFLDTQDYFVYIALLLFLYFFFSDWALQMGIWFTATTLTQEVG